MPLCAESLSNHSLPGGYLFFGPPPYRHAPQVYVGHAPGGSHRRLRSRGSLRGLLHHRRAGLETAEMAILSQDHRAISVPRCCRGVSVAEVTSNVWLWWKYGGKGIDHT